MTESKLSTYVIVGAGGKGERMGRNKQLLELNGKPVFIRTLEVFDKHPLIDGIVLVRPPELKAQFSRLVNKYGITKVVSEADSGSERHFSMYNGLQKVPKCGVVLFHNGANPLVTDREITECIKEAYNHGAAVVANPVKDTIKKVEDSRVVQTLKRSELWAMQTPQGIRHSLALKAYAHIIYQKVSCTDDVQAVEIYDPSVQIRIVTASPQNIKLTTPTDIVVANAILSQESSGVKMPFDLSASMVFGLGEDSHEFEIDGTQLLESDAVPKKEVQKALVIGGVKISNEMSFKANSDGDIVLHAISRAITSSVGGPQLDFFADKLAKEGQIDSALYLAKVIEYAREKGYIVNDARVVIEGGRPRLLHHLDQIRAKLSELLAVSEDKIGLAVHSGERLTAVGRGKGMKSLAFVSMKRLI